MASEEYQEQPAAKQNSSNQEDKESLEQQETIEQSETTSADSEDILAAENLAAMMAGEGLAEEDFSPQTPPETISADSEDILAAENLAAMMAGEGLTEEDLSPQTPPETESVPIEEEENETDVSVTPSSSVIADTEEENTEPTPSTVAEEIVSDSQTETEQVSVEAEKNWWDVIIDKIRSFLPESINNSLSDWVLIGIISGIIVLILSVSVILFSSGASNSVSQKSVDTTVTSSSPSSEVIKVPEQEGEIAIDSAKTEATDKQSTSSEVIKVSEQEQEIAIDSAKTEATDQKSTSSEVIKVPEQEQEIAIDSAKTEATDKQSTSSEVISTPVVESETSETLVAPKKTENVKAETIIPPTPVITPEQRLINSLQEKINKITSQGSDELIVSGEADLLNSRLLLKVSDDWYQLNQSRQDKFANETLKRAQKFKFSKLEIKDLQDNLIARSPVVGNKMVILQRTR